MKTKIFTFSLMLAAGALSARVLTVSNNAITGGNPNNLTRFNNIQRAADSAMVGDTIYVVGSPTDYGNVYIRTKLTLIGAGYAVTGTQYNFASSVDNIYIDSVSFGNIVSGTRILGMVVNSNFDYSPTNVANYIDVERCYISGTMQINGTNWTIRNNDINAINCQNYSRLYFQNNFISYLQYSNQTTVVIDHNDFVINSGSAFTYVYNALITNNVFYYSNPENGTNVTGCTFSNNITSFGSAINLNSYTSNTGSGNIFATPPGWNDLTIPASTVGQNVWIYKWTFKTGSPAHLAATDGTDIGVYGGSYVLQNLTGATRIPQMTLMNVSGIVPQGGNINVNFKARTQK